jgi:hypothetical protein
MVAIWVQHGYCIREAAERNTPMTGDQDHVRVNLAQSHVSGTFRSYLEKSVSQELTSLGVEWEYEAYPLMPDGRRINYLPDFRIASAPETLRLPGWLECKPQKFLYDLRVFCEIDRRFGEYFEQPIAIEGVDHICLFSNGFTELSKPKKLAEWLKEPVLVVGAVGATRKLSIEMRENEIIFERFHPFVNQAGVRRDEQRKEREERYRREREQYLEEVRRGREQKLRMALAGKNCGYNKRPTSCCGCGAWVPVGFGTLMLTDTFTDKWQVVCKECAQ